MNHLKTGNAFFGAGSFKNYKFLGQELQETGFYDMNARFYMADLGRFGMHDPLSASTLDPYGYGYNNPILFADPSGLEGDPVNGGAGPGGPVTPASFGDIPGGYNGAPTLMAGAGANDIAAEQNIQGIILNSKGKTSNSASAMPGNCIACSVGSGVSSGINLPQTSGNPIPAEFYKPVLNNGSAMMMDGMLWDVAAIYIANNVKPENKYVAAGVGLLAIIMSRGHAADEVLEMELDIAKAEAAAAKVETSVLNPKDIHFMQSSIKNTTGEFTVMGNAEALKSGVLNPEVLRINVWKDASGKVWTLDHRRLGAFRLSGLREVPINWATTKEVRSQMWKMITQNGGTSIKLKLGGGQNIIVK